MVVRRSALQRSGDKNAPQALLKPICVQYGRLFRRKMPFVSSTAKRQRGLQKGKLGSPLPCFASFCRSKRNAPAASRTGFAPCKINAPPLGDHHLGLIKILLPAFFIEKPPAARPPTNQPNKIHKSPTCKNPLRVCVRAGPCRGMCTWVRA